MMQEKVPGGTQEAEGDASMPVAELRSVSKSFGSVLAARDLNLSIRQGEFLSFLGPSGCGKTTALRMLAGFETPTEGEVRIAGEVVNDLPSFRRPVNMVFQSYALFPHLTVAQNIAYGLQQQRPRPTREEVSAKVSEALETVRLAGFEGRRIWEMSGGQQQRVALARAIVNRPRLLLLDEPLAALDRKLRKEMQIELQDLQRSLGITFVLVTHDQEEALSLSDRICVMRGGRIVQIGSPRELYDEPASKYVADFVGTSNFFEGSIASKDGEQAVLKLADGQTMAGTCAPGLSVGDKACVSLRPEQIALENAASDGAHPVTVLNRIFLGEHTEYLVSSETLGNVIVLAPRQAERAGTSYNKGDKAWITWREDAARILLSEQ
ncbi:MAG: ABC transporter ATP-binding protein [Rhodobacteraceae bacterium]|nr:ABC transporter ATP-binding protein [Paracoccaceae bacterium]